MRKLVILAFLLLPLCSFADQLSGKWKEVKRWKLDKTAVSYTDTIHIEFLIGNEYIWQKQGGYIYRYTYKVNGKKLDIGMKIFDIVDRSSNKITLKDDMGIYEFAPDLTPTMKPTELPKEAAPQAVANTDPMLGKWSVFKATSEKTQATVDYDRRVKKVIITNAPGKIGQVYGSHDGDDAPSWYVESYSQTDQVLHCNGKDKRDFKVIKCENNELVISNEGITYFLRQFR